VSEFLAEASVLIVPDSTKFRATLIAELEKATKGIVVPVPVVAQAQGARTAVAANKQAAASAKQATVATQELNASRTQQVIKDREAAAGEANLVEAQRLTAVAQGRVTAAEAAGERSTTTLATARAELRASTVAITASERALAAAELSGSEAAQLLAADTLRAAVALRAQAIAAEQAAAGTVVNTRATADAIRRNEQLRRGIEANTLSLFKIRGATLAASSGFLIGAAAVTIVAKAIEEANKEIEAAARVERVFGEASGGLEKDARGLADSFGISTTEALKFEGQIGNILTTAKVAGHDIPKLSEDLVKLAADLAAFANVPFEQTARAITLGLAGNSRGLRQFGVDLSASAVNAEALAQSGKKLTSELTRGEKVTARQTLLFEQTSNAQGAAQRRTEGLAQSSRVLKADITNLGASLGTKLIPFLTDTVKSGKDVVSVLQAIDGEATKLAGDLDKKTNDRGFIGQLKDFALSSLPADLQKFKQSFLNVKDLFKSGETDLNALHEAAVKAFRDHDPTIFDKALIKIAGDERDLSVGFNKLHADQTAAFDRKAAREFAATLEDDVKAAQHLAVALARLGTRAANNQLATVQDQLVGIKIAGGSASDELANLARQEALARKALTAATAANALTGGRSQADLQALRDARNQLLDIVTRERDIRQQMADDATKAAQDALKIVQDAQQKVKDLIQQADQATIDLLTTLAGKLDIRQLRVEATASLQDDVAFQNELQTSLKQRIAIAQSTIIDAKLRTQTVHDLTVQLVQSQIAEKQLNAEIAKNRQQRRAAAFDRASESVDLDIQLAQTEKNKRAEIRARQAKIKLDQERLKAVRGDIIATKRLRNDIAENRVAIKELNKELAKRNDALKEAQFLFLTTQAGFAGTLLSNLIPTSALSGTVGGNVARPTGATNLAGLGAANPTGGAVAGGLSSAVQTHTATKGASMGQMATLIHIQRGMLGVLTRLVGQRTHPEATNQKQHTATATDTV
jgi:hypothetical protein